MYYGGRTTLLNAFASRTAKVTPNRNIQKKSSVASILGPCACPQLQLMWNALYDVKSAALSPQNAHTNQCAGPRLFTCHYYLQALENLSHPRNMFFHTKLKFGSLFVTSFHFYAAFMTGWHDNKFSFECCHGVALSKSCVSQFMFGTVFIWCQPA